MMKNNNENWLIIANGEPCCQRQLIRLAQDKNSIALDGGLLVALEYGITPQFALGDFDSIEPNTLRELQQNKQITFLYRPDQNATDLEKALTYLIDYEPKSVTICNATGWRMDHTLYNLRLLKRFHDKLNHVKLVTATEIIQYCHNQTITIQSQKGDPIALLGFPEATIKSSGLKYNMDNMQLKLALQESTSNHIAAEKAEIKVQGDALLITSHIAVTLFNMT